MKILQVLLALLLISLPSFGQSTERPEGIVIPVATLGDVTETRRQILQNTLIESLSSYYRLVPQDKLEKVQEKIFQEMDYEECTEDQCIVMIQEALQVENLFILQVIGEENDTQLSLKWVGLDNERVKNDYCESCSTLEITKRIIDLVRNLVSIIPSHPEHINLRKNEEYIENNLVTKKDNTKNEQPRSLQIQRNCCNLGDGFSINYFLSTSINLGYDSIILNRELDGESSDKDFKYVTTIKLYTNIISVYFHPFNGSFYGQFGYVLRDWLVEQQFIKKSNNQKTVNYKTIFYSSPTIGLGWNWISSIGFSGGIGFFYVPKNVKHEFTNGGGRIITEENKESWKDYIEKNYRTNLSIIKLGWNFEF